MSERGILMSAPMVRALLAGTKTQTRRVVKPQPTVPAALPNHINWRDGLFDLRTYRTNSTMYRHCPYGQPGDRLWVKEPWRIGAWAEDEGAFAIDYRDGPRREWLTDPNDHDGERFNALWEQCCTELDAKGIRPSNTDGRYQWEPGQSPLRWRPSIFMPRWASRITLEVTAVRVERLQDISSSDAWAEGISAIYPEALRERSTFTRVECYRMLWESINGPGSWDANPWVWVIEFRRLP